MATVTGYTAAKMQEIIDATIVGAHIDSSGHLILETADATEIDAGYMLASVPDASTTVEGIVELATQAETLAGSDAVRAVTPAGLVGSISTNKIVDDAVTTAKILNANVTDAKLATDSVTTVKILNGNVTDAWYNGTWHTQTLNGFA